LVVPLLLCTGVGVAWAASGDLDSVLGDVSWGDDKEQVIRKMKQQRIEALRNRPDLEHDRLALQKARKKVIDKFQTAEKTYTPLTGDDTGYEVSVISGEFTKDANEALMKVNDQTAQRFYFFKDEKLYKLVVAYRQSRLDGISFDRFLKQVIAKYGKPTDVKRAKLDGETKIAKARWDGDSTSLEVRNERQFFGTFVMVFSDRQRVQKLRAKQGEFGGSGKERGVSERVKDLTTESGDDNKDVVEGMLGEKVEVSLGEPADEESDDNTQQDDGADKQASGESKSAASNKTPSKQPDDEPSDDKTATSSGGDDGDGETASSSDDDKKESEENDELIVY
jgi:hypothetical protein